MTRFFGPVGRICVGLVSLTLFLLFIADLLFGVLRDDVAMAQRVWEAIVADLATQLAVLIQKDDKDTVQWTVNALIRRDGEMLSIGIRRNSGDLYLESAEHERHWVLVKEGKSIIINVAVPVYAGKDLWGSVEVAFRPVVPKSIFAWVQ